MTSSAATSPEETAGGPGAPRRYFASTVKHGLVYSFGNALGRIAGFIMLPVYTRVLTTADYGILEILALSTDVLGMVAGLGIQAAMVRFYYQYETDEERHQVVSTAAAMVWLVFAVVGAIGLTFARPLSDALLGEGQSLRFVQLAVTSFVVSSLGDIPGVYFRARQRSGVIVASNFARLMLSLSLNILFVVWLRVGVAGIFYSTILSSVIVGGVMSVRVVRETGVQFVRPLAWQLLAFGAPLIFSQLGSFVLHFSDRFFLRHYHALAAVGVYSLSYKFAMLLAMFVSSPFHTIWSPKALEIAAREGTAAPAILRAILRQYVLLLVSVAFAIALFATDVIHVMLGPQFRDADRPVPVLMLGITFFCFRAMSQTGVMIAKRPGDIAYVTTVAAVVATLLNLLLIPKWAAMGAAVATALAFGVEFVLLWWRSERAYPIGVSWRDIGGPMLIAAGVWLAADLLIPRDAPLAVGLTARGLAAAAYLALLTATRHLTREAWQLLWRSLHEPKALVDALRRA